MQCALTSSELSGALQNSGQAPVCQDVQHADQPKVAVRCHKIATHASGVVGSHRLLSTTCTGDLHLHLHPHLDHRV